MTHTPGPWQAIATNRSGDPNAWDGFEIRNLGGQIATSRGPARDASREADALLLAAAPEMLDALDAIVMKLMPAAQTDHLNADFKPLYEQAKAALAKARGATGR